MMKDNPTAFCPFRPTQEDIAAIAADVAEIADIQQLLLKNHRELKFPDRVAHQYQIAGGKVVLRVAKELPADLTSVGIFEPGSERIGIGRVSTGLGIPHLETNPDMLGLRASFLTSAAQRVDFLALNHPGAPTDEHRDFVSVLHAAAAAAGAELPLIGDWGAYNLGNLLAEQTVLAKALAARMGMIKAAKTLGHVVNQALRTVHSSSAFQTYWTGIVELTDHVGKFSFVPNEDVNKRPGLRPGERHLTEDWNKRQREGDLNFRLYWIPYLNEVRTSTQKPTEPWDEAHKTWVGTLTFPRTDLSHPEAKRWATLAAEMGANPGNWVRNRENTIAEPPTKFETARRIAYELSHQGRGALEAYWYEAVFRSGEIGPELARELDRRTRQKAQAGHVSSAT